MNFLSNAIKFTSFGKNITIRVVILEIQHFSAEDKASKDGTLSSNIKGSLQNNKESYIKFAIEIEDQGVGISEENLGKIFVDFMKLDEHAKLNLQGTGLGLSICKLIVEKMRGKIKVESKLGKGTTFRIIISALIQLGDEVKDSNSLSKF